MENQREQRNVEEEMSTIETKLSIQGMTCGHCARAVKNALEAVSGVSSASVDLESGIAGVTHDQSANVADFVEAVTEEGYTAVQLT